MAGLGGSFSPPTCCPCSHPKHLSLGAFATGKGEVGGRRETAWVWGDGEWDKAGVLSPPRAGDRALGIAEQ